jgi:hypothetical protein
MLSLSLFGFAFGYLLAFLHFNSLLEITRLQDLSGLQISQLKLAMDGRGNRGITASPA